MREKACRALRWLMIFVGGTFLFQFPITGNNGIGGGGCTTFATNGLLNSVDFCYIFDCENGFLGGAIQPCGTGSSGGSPFLLDCNETGGGTETTE